MLSALAIILTIPCGMTFEMSMEYILSLRQIRSLMDWGMAKVQRQRNRFSQDK